MTEDEITETARRVFGHEQLWPGQYDAVRALLDGHDVLLVGSTGSGKSLAYQLPAVLLHGPTLVVSPLLALQADQANRLDERGERTSAARISSAETPKQRREALEAAAAGELEFLFLAPEQLANDDVREAVAALRPSLVAVDEAHCVSSWGHDFRPDYLRLGELLADLDDPRIIAMTATAAPPVRADIVERLRLHDPTVVVGGSARTNIYLGVERCLDEADQRDRVRQAVLGTAGPGIVYVRTRKATEAYAAEPGRGRAHGGGVPRRAGQAGPRPGPGGLHGRAAGGDGGHLGVRHGGGQARHPVRGARAGARVAGLLLPGGRPGGPGPGAVGRAALLPARGPEPGPVLHRGPPGAEGRGGGAGRLAGRHGAGPAAAGRADRAERRASSAGS